MKLFTDSQYQQLIENGRPENRGKNHVPVARLYQLYSGGQQCLISELYVEHPDIGFGLYDDGKGEPKVGFIDVRSSNNAPFLLNDVFFVSKYPLSIYIAAAKICDKISLKEELLKKLHAMNLVKQLS